jgi:hypothetical protein
MELTLGLSLYSLSLSQLENYFVFLIIAYTFSSTKLEIRVEQILSGSKRRWEGEGGGMGGEKWLKPCMHI